MKIRFFAVAAVSMLAFAAVAEEPAKNYSFKDLPERLEVAAVPVYRAVFSLEENATTGYQWSAKYDQKLCKVELRHKSADSELCGAPGKVDVCVTLLTNAPATVVMEYRRPWEKNVPPIHVVRCTVARKAE